MYFIDVQGTLITDSDKTAVSGAVAFIDYLNKHNKPFMIVTNNTKQLSSVLFEYLVSLGFTINKKHYIDPLMLLDECLDAKKVAAYGEESFLDTLDDKGYHLDFENPDYVVIGSKHNYTGEDFAQIISFLLKGVKLVGMHEITLYAKDGKRYPGTGAILKMLHAATLHKYEIIGKPSALFYTKAKEVLGNDIDFKDITMISDDLKGDLVGAKKLGMKTIFVLCGKYKTAEEIVPYIEEKYRPDMICNDMQDVLERTKETDENLR